MHSKWKYLILNITQNKIITFIIYINTNNCFCIFIIQLKLEIISRLERSCPGVPTEICKFWKGWDEVWVGRGQSWRSCYVTTSIQHYTILKKTSSLFDCLYYYVKVKYIKIFGNKKNIKSHLPRISFYNTTKSLYELIKEIQ